VSLRNIQEAWHHYIFAHEAESLVPAIAQNAQENIEIYADAYEARLLEAMEKTFPLLREKLGETLFDDLAIEYLLSHPSHHFSLAGIGEKFSEFLATTHSDASEVAALDWAIHIAMDSKNAIPVSIVSLQNVPTEKWGELCFQLHPSLNILQKHRVWRRGIQVYYVPLPPEEYYLMTLIQKKYPFGEICEKLAEMMSEDKVTSYVISTLQQWFQDELIIGVTYS